MSAEKDLHTMKGGKPGPGSTLAVMGGITAAQAGCPGEMEGQGSTRSLSTSL